MRVIRIAGLLALGIFFSLFNVALAQMEAASFWDGNAWLQIPAKGSFVKGAVNLTSYNTDRAMLVNLKNKLNKITIGQLVQEVDSFYQSNPNKKNTPVIEVIMGRYGSPPLGAFMYDGNQWLELSNDAKICYLKGAGNMLDYETDSSTALKGLSLSHAITDDPGNKTINRLIQEVDSFYQSNPNKNNTPAVEVIRQLEVVRQREEHPRLIRKTPSVETPPGATTLETKSPEPPTQETKIAEPPTQQRKSVVKRRQRQPEGGSPSPPVLPPGGAVSGN
jgi:hypothetical protein